ncbi:MAG: hypothetical protein WCJ56_08660 [bacterium]
MADAANLAYSYKGDMQDLLSGVKKSCEKMRLELKGVNVYGNGFLVTASQQTNWLSTNWPMKFNISAEKVGETYALLIQGESWMGSLTQSANNHAKAQELLSLIKVFAPTK